MDKRAKSTGMEFLNMRLARAYVPFQVFSEAYPLDVALMRGTLFPELYDPYVPSICCD